MSTPQVLRETMARAHALGLTVALLEPAFDVDEVGDLARLEAALAKDDGVARHTAVALRDYSERQESAYGDLTSVGRYRAKPAQRRGAAAPAARALYRKHQ